MRQFLHKLMARFDQGCAATSRVSSASLDRQLSLRERLGLYTHLFMCGLCRRYHRQLIAIQKLTSGVAHDDGGEQPTSPVLNEEARERIKHAIDPSLKH
jgi:hypothetical protein